MPVTSPAQERLMQAAAHTPGGYDGVPQEVGKEFVGADESLSKTDNSTNFPINEASGIAFIVGNKFLLVKRGNGGDHPDTWAFPGGHKEEDEDLRACAIRECREEIGYDACNVTDYSATAGNFTLFFCKDAEFSPQLNYESDGYLWCDLDTLPTPLHPEMDNLLSSEEFKRAYYAYVNELDVARQIRDGAIISPQKFANVWLFNIRITGTGTAYRTRGDEFVYRAPEHYMNDEFLARCNGLSVVWEHPEKGTLNSEEYKNRNIGSIFLPYLKEDVKEVWGIAKIYDEEAALAMQENILSTSPTVVFTKQDGNDTIRLEDGSKLLIEGCPSLLDHVAICQHGVWDKGGDPTGVISDSATSIISEDDKMDKEAEIKAKADDDMAMADAAEKEESQKKFDALMSAVDSLSKRFDAMMEEKAEPKEVVADKKVDDEMAKADAADIKRRIDSVEQMMLRTVSDADYEAMADAQAKADSVASAFGESASRPQSGETVLGYRKRMAAKFKSHSAQYKDIDLSGIADDALFGIVEKQIYSDAISAANSPIGVQGSGLREIKTRSPAGHQISTFKGSIGSWMDNFKADAFKVTHLQTGAK